METFEIILKASPAILALITLIVVLAKLDLRVAVLEEKVKDAVLTSLTRNHTMADFNPAFEKMLHDEGGMQLTNIPGDRGGMTYAGIARNANPQWAGWNLVDRNEMGGPLTSMVQGVLSPQLLGPY